MGTDDLFKKRRAERQQRKYEYKNPKVNSYLIITEGERTEPLYFRGLKKLIQEKVGGAVDIVEAPRIDIHGEGCATGKLIEIADQKVKDAKIIYQNIWVVFDKDDFADFDQAIEAGTSRVIILPGAINLSNIGCICTFVMQTPHCIARTGQAN